MSIIVPVYNTEKYLEESLNSIINQSYTNIEVIIIDDGSTDKSGEIAENYARSNKRISVIHTPNRGLSAARNEGLKYVKGKYLVFIDADDWVSNDYVESLYKISLEDDYDTIMYSFNYVDMHGNYLRSNISPLEDKFVFTEENKGIIYSEIIKSSILNSVNMRIHKSEIFISNNIYFEEDVTAGTDFHGTIRFFTVANKGIFVNKQFYNYRTNPESIINTYKYNYITSIKKIHNSLYEYLKIWRMDSVENRNIVSVRYSKALLARGNSIFSASNLKTQKDKYNALLVFMEDKDVKLALKSNGTKGLHFVYKIEYILLTHNFKLLSYLFMTIISKFIKRKKSKKQL